MDKKLRLPKEGLIEPEETGKTGESFVGSDDVEGHGLPVTPPPFSHRSPGHGGEAVPTDDEIEGPPSGSPR